MFINEHPRSTKYMQDCVGLAQSLIIKIDAVAESMNIGVLESIGRGYTIDYNDPSTWRYYKHLKGDYHEADDMMYVKSLDTLQEIPFTKESLDSNLATRLAYSFDSEYYRELVKQHPEQESLIRGIVNPYVNPSPWLLKDGTILSYQSTLLGQNEYDLIPTLQDRIDSYLSRWFNEGFTRIDRYYVVNFMAGLYAHMLGNIMTIRLRNVRTNQVHDFFITEYLRSFYYLDDYVEYLTQSQKLYLYQNVRRLSMSAGKEDTFQELLEKLLIDRNIPLTAYRLRKNLSSLESGNGDAKDEAVEVSLTSTADTNVTTTRSVAELMDYLDGLAPGNTKVKTRTLLEAERGLKKSRYTILPTKIFQSEVTDTSNFTNYQLKDVLLNEWLRMLGEGRYQVYFIGTNPQSGEGLELNAKEAYLAYTYLYSKSRGLEPTGMIPAFEAFSTRVASIPTKADFRSRIDKKYEIEKILEVMSTGHAPVETYSNVVEFYQYCQSVFNKDLEIRHMFANVENHYLRGMIEASASQLYLRKRFVLAEGNWAEWMKTKGMDPEPMTEDHVAALMKGIAEQLVGETEEISTALKDLQDAMIDILEKFSTYNDRFVKTINVDGMILSDWPSLRIGDVDITEGHVFYAEPGLVPLGFKRKEGYRAHLEYGSVSATYTATPVHIRVGTNLKQAHSIHAGAHLHFIGNVGRITNGATITTV